MIRWKRTLRTYSSERFVAVREGKDVALADIHYLLDGTVSGSVLLDESAGWTPEQVPDLLAALDEDMLPHVDQAKGTLLYTVALGEILGSYEIEPAKPPRVVSPDAPKSRRRGAHRRDWAAWRKSGSGAAGEPEVDEGEEVVERRHG